MRDPARRITILPILASLGMLAIVARAVLALPPTAAGLAEEMQAGAKSTGIKNVVTAVLLDFRGYDTLLEIAVLMLATVAVLSLRADPAALSRRIAGRAGPVLGSLSRTLAPIMIIVAGHLVWVGSSEPGGAFQGGAVLGAAGILLVLSGYAQPAWAGQQVVRWVLTVGLLAFIGVALYPMLEGGALLEYPDESRKSLILFIEILLTLSIGASILSLFMASALADTGGERP
ncbi:MAG: hydrogen gas-evolving membrane-bound hydrogenase subunit E [Coriobacteriia bacterium]|nr:hydrogen gas-evolving membrane-bound hydrogenase subunit E [Coriobacteriia bacterium]